VWLVKDGQELMSLYFILEVVVRSLHSCVAACAISAGWMIGRWHVEGVFMMLIAAE
jgi:hypothetical protein